MSSDNISDKIQRTLNLIDGIGASLSTIRKEVIALQDRVETLEDGPATESVLASVSPRITARSGFIKLHLDQIKGDGAIDNETAYVNLPAATDSLAGLMTSAQYQTVSTLPPTIVTEPYFETQGSFVYLKSKVFEKNSNGCYSVATVNHGYLPPATTTKSGVMSRALVKMLYFLDTVLLELTGIGDERSLEIYANWDPEITSMHNMFQNDKTLVYFPKVDTSKVTNFQNAFDGASNLTTFPAVLDTRSATNINFMFCNSAVKELPWMDTSNVTEAYIVFENCKNITSVPQYDFSKVKSTGWGLFMGCEKLKKVPQLDFSSCSRLENLFLGCPSLEEVEPFVAPKVPWNGIRLFCECVKLSTVPNIDLSLCTQLDNAFQGLPLISNLGNLSTGNCKNFVGAFRFNPNLEKFEGVDVAKATVLRETFQEDSVLTYLKLLNFGTQKSIDMSETFSGVTSWGAGSDENRQSLVDSLLTYSFDRAAAGYAPLAFQLEPEVLARLTDEEIAAITAKGFTITSY